MSERHLAKGHSPVSNSYRLAKWLCLPRRLPCRGHRNSRSKPIRQYPAGFLPPCLPNNRERTVVTLLEQAPRALSPAPAPPQAPPRPPARWAVQAPLPPAPARLRHRPQPTRLRHPALRRRAPRPLPGRPPANRPARPQPRQPKHPGPHRCSRSPTRRPHSPRPPPPRRRRQRLHPAANRPQPLHLRAARPLAAQAFPAVAPPGPPRWAHPRRAVHRQHPRFRSPRRPPLPRPHRLRQPLPAQPRPE